MGITDKNSKTWRLLKGKSVLTIEKQMKTYKCIMNSALVSNLQTKVNETKLPFNVVVGEIVKDENGDNCRDLTIAYKEEDEELLSSTLTNLINALL